MHDEPASMRVQDLFEPRLQNRGQLNKWSRLQFYVAWYATFGATRGNFTPVATRQLTLSNHAVYGIDVLNSTLSFRRYNTACFG